MSMYQFIFFNDGQEVASGDMKADDELDQFFASHEVFDLRDFRTEDDRTLVPKMEWERWAEGLAESAAAGVSQNIMGAILGRSSRQGWIFEPLIRNIDEWDQAQLMIEIGEWAGNQEWDVLEIIKTQ